MRKAETTFLQLTLYVLNLEMSDSLPIPTTGDALPAGPSAAPNPLAVAPDEPPPYDPADYRWVPVRRRPRRDGWTEEKQRRFIETLADTGVVGLAAKEVGMTRESAYKLRRSAHAAAFARAWDAARHHAGGTLEDIAFERAIEGREENVFNEYGEVIATKHVPDNRLLIFLLKHLKPERYARDALRDPPPPPAPGATLDASLRAMEPQLPAPAEGLLDAETLTAELHLADVADGVLPHFLSEQAPRKTKERLRAEAQAAQERSGEAAWEKIEAGEPTTNREFADMCRFIDPLGRADPPRKRYK